MRTAGIALGSNLGDRLEHLRTAKEALFSIHEGKAPPLASPVYRTKPVDCEADTPDFYNAVVEIETSLKPLELLDRTQAIELALGRPLNRKKNSPRTVDLDLIFVGQFEVSTKRLELPHPRVTERGFVLQPLFDLNPDRSLPGISRSVFDLLQALPESSLPDELVVRKW